MNKEINLGNLIIPVIKPQKGKDYYTESEKQELISIVTDNVNAGVLPQEQTRQSNEIIRQNNEQTRQAQETIRQTNETNRQTAETERESAENTRQSNESSRVSAEQTRTQTFNNKMDEVDTAIAGIHTSQNAYDQNATAKTSAFNENATSKTSDYNTNATNKTAEYNENASKKIAEYDAHIRDYEAELATKVDKVIGKGLSSNDFTNEEKAKLAELHNYDDTELSERVDDIEQEQTEQNTNISNNTTNIESLQEENENLKKIVSQLPQVEGQGTEVTLQDTIEAQFTKFDVEGNSVQDGTPSPDNEVPILSAGDNGSINEKISNKNLFVIKNYSKSGWIVTIDNPLKGMPAGDYTISCQNKSSAGGIRTYFSNEPSGAVIDNLFTDFQFGDTLMVRKETLTQEQLNAKYLILYFNSASGSQSVLEDMQIMIEQGSQPTSYVPPQEQDYSIFVQQPFRSNKDKTIRDCFVKKNSSWYERHYINRKIFDGTENWYQYGSNIALRNWDNGLTIRHTDQELQGYLCNIATEGRPSETLNNNVFATFNVPGTADWIVFNINTTVAEFKSYLAEKYASGNPVYVNYILAEPLDLPCTEEQIQQLENRPSTYKDFTYVVSEDETPAYLEVAGIRDINTMFDKVTNAIVSLGGNV